MCECYSFLQAEFLLKMVKNSHKVLFYVTLFSVTTKRFNLRHVTHIKTFCLCNYTNGIINV